MDKNTALEMLKYVASTGLGFFVGIAKERWLQRPGVKIRILEAIVTPAPNTYRRAGETTAYMVADILLKIQIDNTGAGTAIREVRGCPRGDDGKYIDLDPDSSSFDSDGLHCGPVWRPSSPYVLEARSSHTETFKLSAGFKQGIAKAQTIRIAVSLINQREIVTEAPVLGADMKPLS